MKYLLRKSYIDVVGGIWLPYGAKASLRIDLSKYDLENIKDEKEQFTREGISLWLAAHSGDFSSILDWSASIEEGNETLDFPFDTEEGEIAWLDTLPDE